MNSLFDLAQSWLEGFDHDPRRVLYERLYRRIYDRWVSWRTASREQRRMLDVGAGYGNTLLLFKALPWKFVALERFPALAERLRQRLDDEEGIDVEIVADDVISYGNRFVRTGARRFDLTTMILTSQYMEPGLLQETLVDLARMTDKLVLDVTNPHSLYGWWTCIRRWKSEESHFYTSYEIEAKLRAAGFRIDNVAGIGLLSPLSLRSGFKGTVLPMWVVRLTPFLDLLFPRWCHLYYLECTSLKAT